MLDGIPAEQGLRLEASMVLDTRSTEVPGWSFGVDHDDVYLTIREATIRGTDVEALEGRGFFVVEFANVLTCQADPLCRDPRPGTGLMCVFALVFGPPHYALGPRRNQLLRVEYALEQPAAPGGTRLAFVDYLAPRTEINLTIQGRVRRPTFVLDAIPLLTYLFRRGPAPPEPFAACGEDPTPDALDCREPVCR